MNSSEFRKELIKIMPGYAWTVHMSSNPNGYLSATGIQSSGFNRLCTLQIVRTEKDSRIEYEAKSAGFGTRCPWLSIRTGETLAQALRSLQNYYETMANTYRNHAGFLEFARKKHNKQKEYPK